MPIRFVLGVHAHPILAAIPDADKRWPVATVAQSEAGYERVAQQVALLLWWPLPAPDVATRYCITLDRESRPEAE